MFSDTRCILSAKLHRPLRQNPSMWSHQRTLRLAYRYRVYFSVINNLLNTVLQQTFREYKLRWFTIVHASTVNSCVFFLIAACWSVCELLRGLDVFATQTSHELCNSCLRTVRRPSIASNLRSVIGVHVCRRVWSYLSKNREPPRIRPTNVGYYLFFIYI